MSLGTNQSVYRGRMTHSSRIVALVASALTVGAAADLPTYRIDVIGSDLQGFGMNELGDIVGRKVLSGNSGIAFVAKIGGAVEELPLPSPWLGSDAYAINNGGVIVGAVSLFGIASVGSRAAAWYPTQDGYAFVLLGALPGDTFSTASGVNDLGDIVGGSGGIGLGLYSSAALFTGGGVVPLPPFMLAADVNNDRVVLSGNQLLDLDTMSTTTIPLPPGNWQGAATGDLNNVGGFCGYVSGFSGCSTFPVTWMPGIGWTFVGGCATTTSAVSINDQGDTLTFVAQGGLGAVFADEGYVNIGTLIAPDQGNWAITGLSTINNARQILGSGKNLPNNVTQLIRLTPIVFGDLTGDGRVDGADLAMVLGSWGNSGEADLDFSGVVDGSDIALVLGAWTG